MHGYNPKLPKGINAKSSSEKIRSIIIKEFDEKRYEKVRESITFDFLKIERRFTQKLKEIFHKNIPTVIFVSLTNYGVGGSYNPPDTIICNINNKKYIKTVVHEIIHLLLEKWIQKYKIKHWEKERIVDLILNSKKFSFLEYSSWQKNYYGAERCVDPLFDEDFFKSPRKLFLKIKSTRFSRG
jgi:hypothetical protein